MRVGLDRLSGRSTKGEHRVPGSGDPPQDRFRHAQLAQLGCGRDHGSGRQVQGAAFFRDGRGRHHQRKISLRSQVRILDGQRVAHPFQTHIHAMFRRSRTRSRRGIWKPARKRAAIWGEDTDWGRTIGNGFRDQLQAASWTIVAEDYFRISETDHYPLLRKFKDSDVSLIAGTSTAPASITALVKQAQGSGSQQPDHSGRTGLGGRMVHAWPAMHRMACWTRFRIG